MHLVLPSNSPDNTSVNCQNSSKENTHTHTPKRTLISKKFTWNHKNRTQMRKMVQELALVLGYQTMPTSSTWKKGKAEPDWFNEI